MKKPSLFRHLLLAAAVSATMIVIITGMMVLLGINKSGQTIAWFMFTSFLTLNPIVCLICFLEWLTARDRHKRNTWERDNPFILWYHKLNKKQPAEAKPVEAEVFPVGLQVIEREDNKAECRISFEFYEKGILQGVFWVPADAIISLERKNR